MKNPKEIGRILKETRQKRGLTIDEVCNKTRIQPNIIKVLEGGTAGEVLGNIYAVLFLRKYVAFLDLGNTGLVSSYKDFYAAKEEPPLDIEKKPQAVNISLPKLPVLPVALTFILIFFAIFLGIKLKSFRSTREEKAIHAISESKPAIFPIAKDKSIELVLQGADNVWMKVKKDGKVIFEDTLPKGGKKEWSARDKIELWTGRAEALNFTINGTPIGTVGRGNIKNIQISRQGLQIKNKWLLKAKK
ncbi:MAG: DUF4115 domain-containing protein [Candidatus Omnitrophota bacterium]|nr:MAG: DUF4115 domain-containing protein [Candidatus Omnitrophota bacterium]